MYGSGPEIPSGLSLNFNQTIIKSIPNHFLVLLKCFEGALGPPVQDMSRVIIEIISSLTGGMFWQDLELALFKS